MKGHIKNACFRKTLLITLLLIILKYTKYDYLEKENGEKPKYNNDISPPTLLRTYFDVYVNRKNKDVKELKKLLKNVTISNDYLCTVKKVDINIYNKICGNNVSKIILSTERKYGENDLKKKCISTGSSSCTFGEKKKREALFTNYEKRNVYKNSSLLEDFDENENTNKNFLFELFGIIAKIKKIIIDTSNKIISMCLFITGDHEENLFYIKNNKGYDELQNSNFYDYYENSNIYSINKELYGYNEEYANKYLYSFIDISSDNLNINFYQKVVQGENGNIAPEIFKNKNVDNLSKDKKYDSHSKMNDGNKSNWGVSNGKTETNRNINFKNGQFLKAVSDYFWKKNEKWNESKINQSNKLHKKNDEMIHRLIGRILAENDHEYENLSLNPNRDRERARERENERRQEIEWKRQTDKNKSNYSQAEERLLLIIREQNGTQKSDNPDKNTGVTVLEFSRLPPKKRRRVCTILAETESEISSKDNSNDSKASDNQNNSSNESNDKSKDYGPASPTPGDVAECKINMPSNNIEGKESESASRGDKSNSSGESNDKSKDYGPASPTPGDTAEDKINIPSILIEGKEYEDKKKESENKNEDKDKDNDKNKEQNIESNSSDKKNDESKYDSPASPPPYDAPEGKIKRLSRLIAEKESEDNNEGQNKDHDKDQNKESNSSDKNSDESKQDTPASSPAEDIPEGKINRPSRLIAEKESENKSGDSKSSNKETNSSDKSEDKSSDKETNSSDNNNDESKYDSPASPPPYDAPEGKINRPSRLIAEKESENNNEDKNNDKNKEQHKETNSLDNNNGESKEYDPASSPAEDIPEGKINRPSRLIAEKESENKSEDKNNDKNKEQNKESNSSDNNNDESKHDSPSSPPPYDAPEGKINRPSRLIAEKELENKENIRYAKQYKPYTSSNNHIDVSKYYNIVSSPPTDAPEDKKNTPPRLLTEKESENKSEDKNNDKNKEQNKESNSSDKNSDESKQDTPASPPAEDIPEGKINRPSRLIAEKESENKNEDKDKDNNKNEEQNKESNSSDNNNDESKHDSPSSPPAEDIPEGKINRPSRLIAEKELEYKDNEHDKEQFSKKNEINRKKNASYKSMVAENGQKDNEDEEMKAVFEKIKKKKEKEKIKYYPYDIIETMEALSSLSNEEYYMNDGAASRAKTSSILGKYLRQTNASNKHLDINMFFDEKPYRYRKGNYYFINPFPYSIIKMKKNEGLGYSEKIKYDGVYCYSLSFNNNSSLTYEIENSFRNVKPIEEIVPGTLTGFKSDDGYQKMLTPMFVEEDMFLHCAFNNEPNEIENRIASFPVKIFLKKNLNKTKGCSFQINMHDSIYKEYAERESFLSKKIILNDENSSNECAITATNEIIGFQCGPPYNHYTNNNNTSYMDKFFFNYVNNEDIKGGEYFKVEPAHCFEEVNTNEDIENVAPGSFPFPNFEMINGGLKSHHTRYLKLNIRDPNTAISCYCNYYNNGKIIYSGIMTINGKQNYNGLSDSIYSDQDTNKENDNAKQTGRKKNKPNEKNKINKMEKYDYKYFLNLLSYYNPYFMLYRKQPEDVKNDFIYDSKNNNQNNDEFLKKIQNKLTNLKFSDNDKHIHGMDDNLRYKYDNRHSNVYPISDYDSESHFDSERLSDSYEDTFNDDYISPNSNSYYDENTYNPDDLFSNYDDVNIESEYEELDPLQDNVTFQDNKSYEDKTQSIIVINKSKNVNVYIPKNKIKNKSKHIKNIEDIEDKKTKDALLKYLLLTYEETPDKNENLNTKLELFKEYFPSSSKNNILIEEKENDNTSNKIKNTSDIKEESIEPLNEKQINSEIEVSENDFTLDHNKSYNHDNANSNNHEEGITHGKINDDIPIAIMNTILHGLFGHNEYDGNKEENPKKDKKLHQTKNNTIENEDEEDLIKKSEELTEDENTFQKIK
ncbi:hypothetical protein YYE_03191 [Plasmodium vinckei vinckei]|nr:hypothetical protein YYE_03191 [Plasmodium vinckei vinckei]